MNPPRNENSASNLWNTLLTQANSRGSFQDSHVLLLGPRNAGKRSLINTIYQNVKGTIHNTSPVFSKAETSALEYAYIPLKDPQDPENEEDVCKMNIWILDEPEMHALLSSCIKEDTIENMIICICLDFSQPWEAMKTLNKWMNVVNEKLTMVLSNVPLDKQDKMRTKLANYVKTYQAPKFDDTNKLIIPEQEITGDNQIDTPLPEGVLKINLGVPLMIVGTKSDALEVLEREKNGDYKLDFLQHFLRTFALPYSATLLYLSTRQNINLDIFYDYLMHRLHNVGLKYSAEAVHKDSIFIPSGFDNSAVITQTLPSIRSGDIFEEVVCKPVKKNLKNEEVITEDTQSFLQNLKAIISDQKPDPYPEPQPKSTDKVQKLRELLERDQKSKPLPKSQPKPKPESEQKPTDKMQRVLDLLKASEK